MRDNKWLKNRFEILWQKHYPDIAIINTVFVRFGRNNRTRLGSIKFGRRKDNPNTYITLNGYFRDQKIPEYVIDATLTHEMTHYAHGFYSLHSRAHRYPHQGGVVRKEMVDRGLDNVLKLSKRWLKENWLKYLKER